MSAYAKREREQLAGLLLRVGPDEPTLCSGWTTRDLAAHLVVRERRPDASPAIASLRERAERIRLATAARPYEQVIADLRTPPWWSPLSNRLTDELVNTGEFFIHHEDVRRAGPGWEPRELADGHARAIWRGAQFAGRIGLRRLGLPVRVVADGIGEFTVGENPQVVLRGTPGELAMFLSGRQAASRVTVEGPPEQAERLRTASLGLA
jgi:uncharacterized protein (TIGR03085 family)